LASKNPYTDAIMTIADEYRSLIDNPPKEKVPGIMREAKTKEMTSIGKWLQNNDIQGKDFEGLF
tara:strand:- start:1946 stop:2137 length:192 start_codon:yes stop_codon:yes gene_type:complete